MLSYLWQRVASSALYAFLIVPLQSGNCRGGLLASSTVCSLCGCAASSCVVLPMATSSLLCLFFPDCTTPVGIVGEKKLCRLCAVLIVPFLMGICKDASHSPFHSPDCTMSYGNGRGGWHAFGLPDCTITNGNGKEAPHAAHHFGGV